MKHFLTSLFILLSVNLSQAQCTDLFFSEYIEGWSNNKALEIYNPTNQSIDLSAYSISRYSNGGTSPSTTQLSGFIEPFSTFVIGLDKRDPNGEGYEAPMWDGYYTYTDSITGEDITTYNSENDLQSKIDLFVNPIYYFGTNPDSAAAFPTSLYFNGNDAITLEMVGGTGAVIDLIGKVGEDPGAAWTDDEGNYWTKDHTLIRKSTITSGVTGNPITFNPTTEWDSLSVNTFINLGFHDCDCFNNNHLVENTKSINVFPNPSTMQNITIKNNTAIQSYSIQNKLGQIILHKYVNNLNTIEIPAPNIKGIYFLSIKDLYGIKAETIIIQ
ncbi:MAG: hypothetical protein CMP49_04825 [Flavobacteriales bacterium]|jgi:hypothetical protein|nr:hypothetical protein [Flavobacteriales bacterium]|tara:strand:- start:53218 stop:54201 length:984 start_codon:yes stop_codon:yes gene_type:complete